MGHPPGGAVSRGSVLFWSVRPEPDGSGTTSGASPRLVLATVSLIGAGVLMSALAAPLKRYTDAAAVQLVDRRAYQEAVLGAAGAQTTQPYVFPRPASEGVH